jgi:hypothetical protein
MRARRGLNQGLNDVAANHGGGETPGEELVRVAGLREKEQIGGRGEAM